MAPRMSISVHILFLWAITTGFDYSPMEETYSVGSIDWDSPRVFSFLDGPGEILTASGTGQQRPGNSQTKPQRPEEMTNPGEPCACIDF